jgi:hypothetical protein
MEPFDSVIGTVWLCGGGWSPGAGDVAGVSVWYGRSEKVMEDGVDTGDGFDEAGSELRVPAGDPSGVKTAGRSVVVAV